MREKESPPQKHLDLQLLSPPLIRLSHHQSKKRVFILDKLLPAHNVDVALNAMEDQVVGVTVMSVLGTIT